MRSAVITRSRRKNSHRDLEGKRCPQFLAWLRGRPCHLEWAGDCGLAPLPRKSPVEAAHVPDKATKGMGTKSKDAAAIALCQAHHDEQHRIGWQSFQDKYQFNAIRTAERYWQAWPGRIAWESKQESAA